MTTGQKKQSGASLIVVLLILMIVSILGVSGIQISMLAERSARSDRDQQIGWQGAEAGLLDAEYDILGLPTTAANKRDAIFSLDTVDLAQFVTDCGSSGQTKGLCALNSTGKPAWLTVDFTATGNSAKTAEFGTFTSRTFPAGSAGIQPSKPPRYVIEPIPDPSFSRTKNPTGMRYVYRVTSMGFGPNADTQIILQMLYRN